MKPASYWLDPAPPFRSGERGGVESRADMVVVGSGFTGTTAAGLASRGANVVVLEADCVAGQASGRSGGQVQRRTRLVGGLR